MKNWNKILLIVFSLISSSLLFTACEKDACTSLKCKNGGSCTNGLCNCPTGYDGAECENFIAERFRGVYVGRSITSPNPGFNDTVYVSMDFYPINVKFYRYNNPSQMFYGAVNDNNTITISEVAAGNYKRNASASVLNGKMTLVIEEVLDITTGAKTTTTFEGIR